MLVHRLPVAVVDQLAVSGSSLLTGLLVARSETREGFGTFALAYSALLLANSVLMATVIKPFIALDDKTDADAVRGRTGTYLTMQLVMSIVAGVAVVTAGVLAGAGTVFLALGVAIVPVHVLELMRRAFLQRLAVSRALLYNFSFAIANVTGLVVLTWAGRLTGVNAFLVMGASAFLAAVAAARALGVRPERSAQAIRAEVRRAWVFTRWSAPVTLIESLEARGYAYFSAGVLGLTAPALLETGRVLLAPTNILMFPLANLGMPAVSHLSATGALGEIRRVVMQAVLIVTLVVGGYGLATWWFAEPLLGLLYGGRYDDAGPVVRALVAAHLLGCLSSIVGLCLEAMGRPRYVFVAQVWGGVTGLAVAWLLLSTVGVVGAAGGMAMGAAVALSLKAVALRRELMARNGASIPGVIAPKV
jgi:O-antigen/teichoic acid export membrane protein